MANSDFSVVADVDVENIQLDQQNARIRAGTDQNDCIRRILRKRDQFIALYESIAKDGLTTMPILATPNGDGTYTVKDGNRRITCIKLLNNPQLCPEADLRARIIKFIATHKNFPKQITLTVTDNEQAMVREVLSRHQGTLDGSGQMGWSAYLRTLYLINHGHAAEYKRPGQYALWAEAQGMFVDDDFPISSLQRFFNAENLALLGFDIDAQDGLKLNLPKATVQQMTTRVVGDFGAGKSVNDVFSPEQAKAYIADVRLYAGIQPPAAPQTNNSPTSPGQAPIDTPHATPGAAAPSTNGEYQPPEPPTAPRPPRAPPSPATPSADRNKVFGSKSPGIAIPTTGHPKAQTIVAELRCLKSSDTPLAASMLIRALIELSDAHYRKTNSLPDQDKLAKNIKKSALHMLANDKLSDSEEDMIKRLCNPSGAMLEIETLQKMIHRSTHNLDRQFVNTLWDNIGCFVRACWP